MTQPDSVELLNAQVYDNLWTFRDDIDLLHQLIEGSNLEMVEWGSGTGRVLKELARSGHRVTGVERAPAMLARCRQVMAATDGAISLVEGDMVEVQLGQRFDLGLLLFDTVGLLADREKQLQALRNMAHHLKPTGRLVVDVTNFDGVASWDPDSNFLGTVRHPESGHPVDVFEHVRVTDPEEPLLGVLVHFDECLPEGAVRRLRRAYPIRPLVPEELHGILIQAGFSHVYFKGDHAGAAFDVEESPRCIAIAHL